MAIARTVYLLQSILLFFCSFLAASEQLSTSSLPCLEPDEIYWETPAYLSKLEEDKVQYVYHRRTNNFIGDWIFPLNLMPFLDGFSSIYEQAISKYEGRELLMFREIPTLNCLWNDVIFLSPLHPHEHYKEYKRIGFTPKHIVFFKIPIEVLKDKRVTVWKWMSYKKYPVDDPIHESIESYCALDFALYQEMDALPEDTKEFYQLNFDPENPAVYPKYNWYRIPHILCQDPIDLLDKRITLINWKMLLASDCYLSIKNPIAKITSLK